MGIFNKILPFATVGATKIFPTHFCIEEFEPERLHDHRKPDLVRELSLFEVSLEYMKLCFELTSLVANLKHQFCCQYQIPLLSSDLFCPRFEAQKICNTVQTPFPNNQIKETEAHDEEIDFEAIKRCDPNDEIDPNVSDALMGINFSELLNLLGVGDENENTISNHAQDEDENTDSELKDQDENPNVVKSRAVRELKFVPSEEVLVVVPLGFTIDFDKEARRIVQAIKQFLKEVTNKMMQFGEALMKATSDERIVDALMRASSGVASVVKRIIGAIHYLIDTILVALNLKEADPKKRAISIAQTTADTTKSTANTFFKEANGLMDIGSDLTKAAGNRMTNDTSNAVSKLSDMSHSVTSYARQLENEAKLALTFIKTLLTK